jgi:hypothetical protein
VIFVIFGERVPFIFRKAGAEWRLVGAAFVPRNIRGQAFDVKSPHYLGNTIKTIPLVSEGLYEAFTQV